MTNMRRRSARLAGYSEHMHRRILVLAATSALAVSTAGCAVQPPTSVTDTEAHERFVAVLDDTQGVVGSGWRVLDDPTPRECVIPLWVSGQRYPALRIGDAPAHAGRAADQVEAAWNDRGMRVTRTDVGDVIEVKGESADGELYILRVSENASTLLGESECRPR